MEISQKQKQIGKIFTTPLIITGNTWLPLSEGFVWLIMAVVDHLRHPGRSVKKNLATGALTSFVILGSEWLHNLAHAAAASLVGKKMDLMRVQWGMPRCIYNNVNDLTVTPREHILRALGGPIINTISIPFWLFLKRSAHPESTTFDVAEAGLAMNTFLSTVSLLPVPGIDGGPILKWGLVSHGIEPHKADDLVANTNRYTSAGLTAASVLLFKKKKWFLFSISALMAVISGLVGYKVIKE